MNPTPDTHTIWLTLAELFFLDTEAQQHEYTHAVELLRQAGWSRVQTHTTLVELIAPIAGDNLGFLIYPVIGEWAAFDKGTLCTRIEARKLTRTQRPKWHFWLQDKLAARMLKRLEVQRLLDLLET